VTRIELRVSGKNREMLLSRALPESFVPMALDTPLPARLDPDGRLRVQLRPGAWTLELRARRQGPAAELTLPPVEGPWATEEIWAFEARNDLRLVSVEGVAAIDPQQTQLPVEWRSFPAYRMAAGNVMKLVEKRRGNAEPAPDQLSLQRTWWLDFDGGAYTIRDSVSGTLSQSWRLDMPPPVVLGRVSLAGRDQLITRGKDGAAGVEIRQGQVQMDADSRIVGERARVPAVGWGHDFQQVSGTLNLPPGWRLFYASGVDDVSSTWVTDWTLLDLFLVLIIALAAARVWGRAWGVIALATLALIYLEPGAPRWLWLALLAAEALLAVLPPGRFLRFVTAYRLAVAVALVVVAVPFAITQVRVGMYPALEIEYPQAPPPAVFGGAVAEKQPMAPAQSSMQMDALTGRMKVERKGAQLLGKESLRVGGAAGELSEYRDELQYVDAKAKISTGPGLPRWQWNAVSLGWRGPVERTQTMHLVLLSPATNLLLAVMRVVLLGALLLRGLRALAGGSRVAPAASAVVALIAVLGLTGFAASARAADFPPPELLKELQQRLLEHPECFPSCAASPRMRVEADASGLVLRLEIDAGADTAVPLPAGARGWSPAKVLLDGEPAPALARDADGVLWASVGPGKHQLVLDGPLPPLDTVEIPLPLKPRYVESSLSGWTLEGVREDGVAEDYLRLSRERKAAGAAQALEPGEMPPFARLEREIHLGLSWEVDSVLTRLTPPGAAFTVAVPLLAGEAVTTPNLRVDGGKAIVIVPPSANQVRWRSILKDASRAELKATPDLPVAEVWRLDASPLWHVEVAGIPEIHQPPAPQRRLREWRPWPGESVTLAITRPEAAPGQTLTVDHTALEMSPGLRATDVTLAVELRSSLGGQHVFTLPEEAELQSVTINGGVQPIRQEKRSVTLPIVPGTQTIGLVWRSPDGIAVKIRSPQFSVGLPTVNADTTIHMSADRWTLAAGGGRLGPAVLFWSVLVVVVAVSVALGRVRSTPLRSIHWFLLGLGLTQAPMPVAVIVAGWLLALGWRLEHGAEQSDGRFDFIQVMLALWTAAALGGLFVSIQQGLLGLPEMQISGNGSNATMLRWFHDRSAGELPRTWVVSVPLYVYRLAMLAWALWIASALLSWLRWGWTAFSRGGLWRPGGWRLPRRRAAAR
ncbi:MAG TPA: hypothetical protein VMR29_00320, partial [Candidatus Binatia bacterium]|nr:hypothetical protein [Candidatus Binatia bacterium]